MTPHTPCRWWTIGVAACGAAMGCSTVRGAGPAPVGPVGPTQVAMNAASALERAGDSALAVDGDSAAANRYYGAASVLRRHPAFDTVMIVVDGSPANFNAVALAVADSMGAGACPAGRAAQAPAARSECRRGSPRTTYTLFAWRAVGEREIVQVVAPAVADESAEWPVRTQAASDSAGSTRSLAARQALPARLTYSAGRRGAWRGRVNSHTNVVAMAGRACVMLPNGAAAARAAGVGPAGSVGGLDARGASCQQDGFIFAFEGTIVAPPGAWGAGPGSTTHVVWMAPSHVSGAYLTVGTSVASR